MITNVATQLLALLETESSGMITLLCVPGDPAGLARVGYKPLSLAWIDGTALRQPTRE